MNDTLWDRMRAQVDGRNAQVDGKPKTANPYKESPKDDLKRFWEIGWHLSRMEDV